MKDPKIVSVKFHTGVPVGKNGTELSATTIKPNIASMSNRYVEEIQLVGTWGIALIVPSEEFTTVVPFTNVTALKVDMKASAEKQPKLKPTA